MPVHVTGTLDVYNICIVDNSNGHTIITYPDLLISNTQLSDSFLCLRRSVLQGRMRVSGGSNAVMLYGLMLHELLQRVLRNRDFSDLTFRTHIRQLIQDNLETLYCVEEDEVSAERYLVDMLPNLRDWMNRFLGGQVSGLFDQPPLH
jgi:hypothetical protein